MAKTKYSIKVLHTEKELYRICKDLEKHGRTMFKYDDSLKQQTIASKIGLRGKHLVERDLFFPPARTRQHSMNIVALPINVKIEERKNKNFSRFFFQRI